MAVSTECECGDADAIPLTICLDMLDSSILHIPFTWDSLFKQVGTSWNEFAEKYKNY